MRPPHIFNNINRQRTAIFKDFNNSANLSEEDEDEEETLEDENQSDTISTKKKDTNLTSTINPLSNQDSDTDDENIQPAKRKMNMFSENLDELLDSDDQGENESFNQSQRRKPKNQKTGQKQRTRLANDKLMAAMGQSKSGENMNFKRSIEIRNGIAIRSTNNVHRMTN